MLKQITLSAAVAASTTTAAFAGGLAEPTIVAVPATVPMAPVPAPSDWTGFYVGGSIGTGDVKSDGSALADALSLGVNGGYLADLGDYVIGGELEYSALDFENAGDDFDASVLRLKARAGYDLGALLPYVTAGAAQLTIEDGSGVNDFGYFYGVGADYAVTDSIRVGGEVLQHEFEDFNNDGADISATTMGLRVSYSF